MARKSGGPVVTLRPIQQRALDEARAARGLVLFAPVGSGKSLIAGLLPKTLGAERPLVVTKAGLVAGLLREWNDKGLEIVDQPEVVSYHKLADRLAEGPAPDLVIADEAHVLGRANGFSKAFSRWFNRQPAGSVVFCGLSGTLVQRSVMDLYRLLGWALGDKSPLPTDWNGAKRIAAAIDPTSTFHAERLPVRSAGLGPTRREAWATLRRKLSETPGVVLGIGSSCDQPLQLGVLPVEGGLPQEFQELQRLWADRHGNLIDDALEHNRLASAYALGWDPVAEDWLPGRSLRLVDDVRRQGPCVVWVDSVAFGRRLASDLGVEYYGEGDGAALAAASGRVTVVASVQAHGTGSNLQQFHRAVVLAYIANGAGWEQLLGRLHRAGQTRPVTYLVHPGLRGGLARACEESRFIESVTGGLMKLEGSLG